MNAYPTRTIREINQYVRIPAGNVHLLADLHVPEESSSLVILANDGCSRNHPRIRHAARYLREKGIGTLACDLLTDAESGDDDTLPEDEHDVVLLGKRLVDVTRWLQNNRETEDLRIGYFGACAGAAAAIIAAAEMKDRIGAVICRGGRLDLARDELKNVTCPTLLIVGEDDPDCLEINTAAFGKLRCEKSLKLIPGATHRFGEPGKLEDLCLLGAEWLKRHLVPAATSV